VKDSLQAPLVWAILAFGLLAGLNSILQGIAAYILDGMGFNALEASIGSCLYQLSSAVVGTGLGFFMKSHRDLEDVLFWLHGLMVASMLAFLLLEFIDFGAMEVPVMVLVMTLLGSSIFGINPFLLEYMVYLTDPVSENVSSGLIYFLAMSIAAGGTQASTYISARSTLVWLCALAAVEVALYAYSMPRCRAFKEKGGIRGEAAAPGSAELPAAALDIAIEKKDVAAPPPAMSVEISPSKRSVSVEDMVKMV